MTTSTPRPAEAVVLWGWSLALLVLGSRLAVLSFAGSPLPYYDQWLAEYNNMLLPIAGGQGFSTLIERHNEHVLFTTKLLTLAGFLANGYWDVPFLSVCAAIARAMVAMLAFRLLARGTARTERILVWILCALVFAVPLSGYNLMNGMQVSFYLADLCLLAALHGVQRWPSAAVGGTTLVLATLTGIGSMASGILIPAATLAAHLSDRRARSGFWPAWTVSALLSIAYALPIIQAGSVEYMNPDGNWSSNLLFLLQIVSWPGSSVLLGGALIVLVLGAVMVLRHAPGHADARGAIIGLGLYAGANAVLLALNREPGDFHPRHWETVSLLPLTALALGIRVAAAGLPFSRAAILITGGLGTAFTLQIAVLAWTHCRPYLIGARESRTETVLHYRTLLITEQALRDEGARMNRLLEQHDHAFFDDPRGRFALHPVVVQNLLSFRPVAHTLLAPEILPVRPRAGLARMTAVVRDWGWLGLVAGAMLAFTAVKREDRSCPPGPSS